MTHQTNALEFRKAMGQPIGTDDFNVRELQYELICEELDEFADALDWEDDHAQLKELSDLVYVCYQYAAARGWDLDEALGRIHTSNMSKLVDGKPLRREDGKVLKGPNYQPPNLSDLV